MATAVTASRQHAQRPRKRPNVRLERFDTPTVSGVDIDDEKVVRNGRADHRSRMTTEEVSNPCLRVRRIQVSVLGVGRLRIRAGFPTWERAPAGTEELHGGTLDG